MNKPQMATLCVAAIAITLAAGPAAATPIVFNPTGAIVDYVVPTTGQYTIAAIGARGGDGHTTSIENGGAGMGGAGAEAAGTFTLTQGEILQILVGAAGSTAVTNAYGNGGGGSFVFGPGNIPLVVGGGGGGGGAFPSAVGGTPAGYNGGNASTGPDGGTITLPGATFPSSGAGGTDGADGQGGAFIGTGQSNLNEGHGIASFPASFGPGPTGGGGLALLNDGTSGPGGGGGGGYGGGGGGGETNNGSFKYGAGGAGGGGGGSYSAGINPLLLAGIGTGDGSVTLTADTTPVPEPGSLVLLGTCLAGLSLARAHRRGRRR